MNNVNKTLYIPLYGKSYVSKKGIILNDKLAENIWEKEAFPLRGKAKSKWLAYYMGMRSRVFDDWVISAVSESPDSTVIHIGCGLDSRALRVGVPYSLWYDVDFPEVIAERRKHYEENGSYKMIKGDARESAWLDKISPSRSAIIIMEVVIMYLIPEETAELFLSIGEKFENVRVLVDCYSAFAAKMSKYKNPINTVGVTEVFGIDEPEILAGGTKFSFIKEHEITPQELIDSLKGSERAIFKRLYGGRFAKKLYKLYEYST